MDKLFISRLEIKQVRHLRDIIIPLSEQKAKHLILTGKNGSGKTSVTEALARDLNKIYIGEREQAFKNCQKELNIKLNNHIDKIPELAEKNHYILAYYEADRMFCAEQPRHVEKVQLKDYYELTEFPRNEFVKYLLDLKMTEALARNNNKIQKADEIKNWFVELEQMLKQIFDDETVKLEFDEDTFEFHILQQGKEPFDFFTLSRGYQAVLDIVLDIMMRMQYQTQRSFHFNLPGIVIIDEIETHLHLELQRTILPFLTTFFPNIQFIVTSHSPFILNSIDNVVIYDLENHTLVEHGLDDVTYEGVVEGYFRVDKLSDTLKEKFERYKHLVAKKELSDDELGEIAELELYLDEIPDYLAIGIATEYKRMKLEFMNREDIDGYVRVHAEEYPQLQKYL